MSSFVHGRRLSQCTQVIKHDLQLLAQISSSSEENYFKLFMINLLELFSTDRKLLETRGSLIIRQLCLNLNTERIYRTFAEILEKEEVSYIPVCSLVCSYQSVVLGSRVRERHGCEAQHDLDHVSRACRVPQEAEEPGDAGKSAASFCRRFELKVHSKMARYCSRPCTVHGATTLSLSSPCASWRKRTNMHPTFYLSCTSVTSTRAPGF